MNPFTRTTLSHQLVHYDMLPLQTYYIVTACSSQQRQKEGVYLRPICPQYLQISD